MATRYHQWKTGTYSLPSHFEEALFKAYAIADSENRALLATSFPLLFGNEDKQPCIVLTLVEGVLQTQAVATFTDRTQAEHFYTEKLIQQGFRPRNSTESFREYIDAYRDWTDTDACPFDPMDWEIHLLELSF